MTSRGEHGRVTAPVWRLGANTCNEPTVASVSGSSMHSIGLADGRTMPPEMPLPLRT